MGWCTADLWLYILENKGVHWRDDKWKKIKQAEQEIVNRRKKVIAYCGFSFSTKSSLYWCGSVNTPLKWNTLLSGKNLYLSVFSVRNSLWPSCGGNHLFLNPSFLPCYSLYLLTLTSSTLKLPHCWCSGCAFPNIKPTRAFSSFYILLLSLPQAVSFLLPQLIGINHVVAGLRERWWWLEHVSNAGRAFR